jgi:hypothetical protein
MNRKPRRERRPLTARKSGPLDMELVAGLWTPPQVAVSIYYD